MHITRFLTITCLLVGFISSLQAREIVVIVHPDNPVNSLSSDNLLDIYTGRLVAFPDGTPALPVDLSNKVSEKADFYLKLTGKSLSQMSSYWAKLLFTGRYSPPMILDPPARVVEHVSSHLYAIGYIDEAWLTPDVKVVYRINLDG